MEYVELTRLIERLHRRLLDVLRVELGRLGVRDINGVQALLLANIGDREMTIRDLVQQGYYQGPNVSYNIKKLVDLGYLEHDRAQHDKRSVNVRLTAKALDVVGMIRKAEQRLNELWNDNEVDRERTQAACQALRGLERTWSEHLQFRA
jgi:DNA-binding MarR family transcriptional regulator